MKSHIAACRPFLVSACLLGLLASSAPAQGSVTASLKIGEAEGGFTGVLRDRDRFGSAVASVGDLDGDGVADLAAGMPGGDRGGNDSGAMWIHFMNDDKTVRQSVRINSGRSGFAGPLDYTENFGSAIANLGDVDGDGVVDLGVGVPGNDGAPLSCFMINCDNGGYWVLFMNSDGTVRDQTAQNGGTQFGGAARTLDRLGAAMAGLGDVDGDGVPDLAAGAPGRGGDTGILWIMLQNADGSFRERLAIAEGLNGFGGSITSGSQFASALANVGDLDGDGIAELAVGAPFERSGSASRGTLWILFLNADGSVRAQQRIDAANGGFGGALADGDRFGSSVAAIGDLDGDGIDELAVGARGDDDGGTNRGAVWILFLNDDGTVRAETKISDTAGGFTGTLNDSDLFGSAVAPVRTNADGSIDLAVGTPRDDGAGLDRGAFWVLTLDTQACATPSAQVINGSGENPETLSWASLARIGQPLELVLDCSAYSNGVGTVIGRGSPQSGVFTASGERLIDFNDKGALPFRQVDQHRGGTVQFSIEVPNDPALCGQALYVQGLCRGPSGPQLSNAIEFVIGG